MTEQNASTTQLAQEKYQGSRDPQHAQIKFGTDGWRAIIAREYTFANLDRVAQAFADFINQQDGDNKTVVVGGDRRFMSEDFAHRVAEILKGNGITPLLYSTDVPTQLVSWVVKDTNAQGGVMITASHNPPLFNGFKIKAPFGGSAPPETTKQVEAFVDQSEIVREEIAKPVFGQDSETLAASVNKYRQAVENYVDLERIRALDANVVIDSMHGSGGRWIESFLKGGKLKYETIRADRDAYFGGINPEPIDQNCAITKQTVLQNKALVAVLTDGDADRVGAVSDEGKVMSMLEVVPFLILHLVKTRGMTGGIVRTFSQSVLMRKIANALNLPLHETPIGFKYIADLMMKDDILLGAEESGGIGVKGHIPERDGILNSLLILEAIAMSGKTPSELVKDVHREFGEFYFNRLDLHLEVARGQALVKKLADESPSEVAGYKVAEVSTMDGTKLIFDDESWLLFRQSGTEPALRIYAEATSLDKTNKLLEAGHALTQQ